ncbi:hypothetical protein TMatcc_008719 [Talaromyces marneffei ATCC 18224]|uniref:Uncharacterized protein n=2 Tax=Talaromyces marneffei TaxID=37727 RepID=B6QL78_TALMQ|nr:conserved hypothetical protein [Talaromyces marneffei ATCC 18224]KAE8550671.1 hypothetical protein EYB25_006899 [Talaromyces marneffei]
MPPPTYAPLDEELQALCKSNRIDDIEALLKICLSNDSSYIPAINDMILAAVDLDAADIVACCLFHGATVPRTTVLRRLNVHIGSNGFETYKVLIETKVVDISYYIPLFGDVLGIIADANNINWVRYCLEHGADPNKNLIEEFKTPLAAAAGNGNMGMVQLLLDYGTEPKESGAIVVAAEEGHAHIVELLLENGVEIDEIGVEGPPGDRRFEDLGSALHKAIIKGHDELAVWLTDHQ